MDINHLVRMANDIGAYFAGYPNHDEAVEGIANHLRNFWEARMRSDIIEYVADGGDDLKPLVREAVLTMSGKPVDTSEEVGEG
jgi:formate dehydrogenase subunit delta